MSGVTKDRVVVPVDFSEKSFAAVDEALAFVPDASRLHMIHVLPLLAADEPVMLWAPVDEQAVADQARSAIEKRLTEIG